MVYCGKPSKGCSHCRQRKIRCDQGVPACSQCIKAQKECSGYRNMLDLAFRNESEHVIKKANAKSRKTPPRSKEASPIPKKDPRAAAVPGPATPVPSIIVSNVTSDTFPTLFSDDWQNTESATPSFPFCMQPTAQESGFNYFISNFVRLPNGPSHGHFSYVDHLYRTGALNDTLQVAITATGLASHATKTKSATLMARARREYALSLRNINAALISPTERLKDCTLMAILVVAVFESIAGAKSLSLKEWTEHINGAATLVKIRGRNQLKDRWSRGLFIHATSHVAVSCMQRDAAMPPQLVELRAEALKLLPVDPGYQYLGTNDALTTFRNALKTGAIKDPEAVIARALTIDKDLVRCFIDVPHGWMYETVFTETDCEVVFDGSYDVYFDHWTAQLWNAMRANRIMLHETIRSQLIQGFTSTPPQFTVEYFQTRFQDSVKICTQMRDEIFRGVPQHLGFVTRKPFTSPYSSTTSSPPYMADMFSETEATRSQLPTTSFTDLLSDNTFDLPPPKETLVQDPTHPSIGGYFLLWPLYVSGITRVSNAEHRKFVANTLQYVGETIGIRAGSNLAAFMREHSMQPPPANESWRGKMGPVTASSISVDEVLIDEKPKRPLIEMLAREEMEREERLRAGRAEVEGRVL
ncbi:uncharacterized protein LY89DRAFT_778446 [Mollisia scopiformis]|uniref:Zn(2)-C6 fungal-type domain-containing protein n=1 Tax=Mollisia scopiformis TaxID=149040 RepID=A0A194XPF3_MOLSC|nr:uncharacterized protein LY89DRAFT_778446 [Mollisia scopiformis]KUJ22130.1 hypothetical protein LY89DRAFT_778446 [Mollisia scopiformis]